MINRKIFRKSGPPQHHLLICANAGVRDRRSQVVDLVSCSSDQLTRFAALIDLAAFLDPQIWKVGFFNGQTIFDALWLTSFLSDLCGSHGPLWSWLDGWGSNSLDPSWSVTHLAGSVGYYTAEWAGANCVTRARCAACLIIKVEC